MGGTYLAAGNTSPTAEFNIRQDPEAAAIVLESGLTIRLYPLDVFRQVALTRADIDKLMAMDGQNDDAAAHIAGRILDYACTYFQQDRALIGDAGAVASVIAPTGTTLQRLRVAVELSGRISRGQTVLDRRTPAQQARLGEWGDPAPNEIDVITEIDAEGMKRLFINAMQPNRHII